MRHLVKKYQGITAVDDISFDVYQGEIFGLLGPNGAGKTTTLEMMETLRTTTSGTIRIQGFDTRTDVESIKQLVGVQLQAAGYYPNLTLNELIDLFSGLYNAPCDKKALLKTVALEEKARSKYKTMSGGQKQRFSIATTFIHRPRIIFLDEPTTGLDPHARRNLWKLIREIRDQGTTIVLTTHYMEEAENLCDRVAIIERGRIIAIDTPDNLIRDLVSRGFKRPEKVKEASLEDVFMDLTGHEWRDE